MQNKPHTRKNSPVMNFLHPLASFYAIRSKPYWAGYPAGIIRSFH
jgi:hypothetical protein